MTDIRGLGYLRIQTTDIARWRELVVDGLGMAIGSGPEPDGLYLRIDERRARLIVLPGETDKALAVGWEVRQDEAGVTLSNEWFPEHNEDHAQWRGTTFIPRGMIKSIGVVEL